MVSLFLFHPWALAESLGFLEASSCRCVCSKYEDEAFLPSYLRLARAIARLRAKLILRFVAAVCFLPYIELFFPFEALEIFSFDDFLCFFP